MTESSGRLTLWGVEIFVATAEEASISAAARRLGTSAATVSQQLTNLETALGTTLIDRAARPVALTLAGETFLRRANAILNEADQARADLALGDHTRATRFRIGMIEDFDADVTPRLLSGLAEEMPHCRFLLETGASHRLAGQLEDRALDVIVAADLGTGAEGMVVRPLIEEPFVVAVPKGTGGHDLGERLRERPLVLYTARHLMGRTIAAHLARQDVAPASRFELDSYHAILAMVADGAGWSILTPLGCGRARRFEPEVELWPLPFGRLSRTIQLTARAKVLGEMPERMATRLKGLLADLVVAPSVAAHPWLNGALRVL